MKGLLALIFVASCAVAEPPAPYPARGWRPTGPAFELPQRGQNPNYLPPLDPRIPASVPDVEADVTVQGLPPRQEQQPIFQPSPINGQQYVGPRFNNDIRSLDQSLKQTQFQIQQQKAREFARQRQENEGNRQPSTNVPKQFIPRTTVNPTEPSFTTQPDFRATIPSTTESDLNEGETDEVVPPAVAEKQKVSVEVTRQNIQEYPPELFLNPLAQLRLQPVQLGQLRSPFFAGQEASQKQVSGFDAATHFAALPSVLAQQQLAQQQALIQGQLPQNQAYVVRGQTSGAGFLIQNPQQLQVISGQYEPLIQPLAAVQGQNVVLQPQGVNQVQPNAFAQPKQQDEDDTDDEDQSDRQPQSEVQPKPQSGYQPQVQVSYQPQPQLIYQAQTQAAYQPQPQTAYQPQAEGVFQQPQTAFQQPQAAYQPQPQTAYQPQAEGIFQQQQTVFQQPQVAYQPQPAYQPQAEGVFQQPQTVFQQPQVAYQPQPQTVYQPQAEGVFQQPQAVFQQPQVAYQPQPQTAYQPQAEGILQQQQTVFQQPQVAYQPQSQTAYQQPQVAYQPQPQTVYQPQTQVAYQPQAEGVFPQPQTLQPQTSYQPQVYQPQADQQLVYQQFPQEQQNVFAQGQLVNFPGQTLDQYYQQQLAEQNQQRQGQDALQSGFNVNQQGNSVDEEKDDNDNDQDAKEDGATVTAVATAFGTRTQPRVYTRYGAPVPRAQNAATTESTVQEPTTENGPVIAEATAVAGGRRKSAKLRSRRVRPVFTLDRSGHLVLAQDQ